MDPYASQSMLHILQQQLKAAQDRNAATAAYNQQGELIKVPGIGKALSSAYEQLRNAAEYTEEHLLLQRAIRRYYYRGLSLFTKRSVSVTLGEELIVELTQAGYIQNNSYGTHVALQLQQMVESHMHSYQTMRDQRVSRDKAVDWTLDVLSVATEELLHPHYQLDAIASTAYQHYLQVIPKAAYVETAEDDANYQLCLYIATLSGLLKFDIASTRHHLLQMYQQSLSDLDQYISLNRQIDELYNAPLTQKLKRAIGRHGAPFRVLKSLASAHPTLHELLTDKDAFMQAYHQQVNKEYKDLKKRLNKGIIKSIIFILITKTIIGLGVEVPYDLIFIGSVAMLPLLINLLFPPLYMASLKLGLHMPSKANAEALGTYMEQLLYPTDASHLPQHLPIGAKRMSGSTKVLYSILFLIPLSVMVYVLQLLHFNIVQGIIFFIFLSTASFLGFRLSRLIRELELVVKQQNLIANLRDFFYLPFILVGQWISAKYARVNAVAFFLDIAIELPMKSVMRLVRQWTRFLNEKHEELY